MNLSKNFLGFNERFNERKSKTKSRVNKTTKILALPLSAVILMSSAVGVISASADTVSQVGYAVPEQTVTYTGSAANASESYLYFTDEKCTTLTGAESGAASEGGIPANAGTYYAITETSLSLDVTPAFKLTILKADSYIAQSDIKAADAESAKNQISAKVTGSTGEVTTICYTDEACTALTTSENGAAEDGGIPSKAGTYFVKSTVAADDNYNSASVVSKLIIEEATDASKETSKTEETEKDESSDKTESKETSESGETSENSTTVKTDTADADMQARISSFISDSRWTNNASYGFITPLLWPERQSWGCCAYSIDFIIYVHGKQIPPGQGETYYNFDEVKVGDVLYQYEGAYNEHYVCVCAIEGDQYLIAEGALNNEVASVGWYTRSGNTLYPNSDNIDPYPGTFTFGEGYHFT